MVASARVANLIGLVALSFNIIELAASPTSNSVSPPIPQEITVAAKVGGGNGAQSNKEPAPVAVEAATSLESKNNAERLKRGLTNFMNHLNPAPYFVPLVPKAKALLGGAQATIVNEGSSPEVVIKGPNRLVQARQLGGPLRWGRR